MKDEAHYKKAIQRIPRATQTNAKRRDPDLAGAQPAFIASAKGCRITDLDGNTYIDYRCGLGPVLLGYRDQRVDAAVREQMERGTLFSMAAPVELEAAEAILGHLRWPDKIRFMKTGADACTACVRLARAFTGRDHILSSGYHGYHDTFAANNLHSGVPEAFSALLHEVPYGDVPAAEAVFERHGHALAAAIVTPFEWDRAPAPEWLAALRELCDRHGAVLIFDEILTGFRLAAGGAREYFGVTPDLAAYAKGIANGYPLSAFAGKARFMDQLEKTVITTTYAGETLSLAAAKACMEIYRDAPVVEHLFRMGARLKAGIEAVIAKRGLPARVTGLEPALWLHFEEKKTEKAFFRSLFRNGVFANNPWFISFAHEPEDIDETLAAMDMAAKEIQERSQ